MQRHTFILYAVTDCIIHGLLKEICRICDGNDNGKAWQKNTVLTVYTYIYYHVPRPLPSAIIYIVLLYISFIPRNYCRIILYSAFVIHVKRTTR